MRILFPLSAVLGILGTAAAQPLLLLGQADAEIRGAFAYDILKSPLSRPLDRGRAQAVFNLPVNLSADAQGFLGDAADSSVVMPELFARVSQDLNVHLDLSAPVLGGAVFFAARENASLAVRGALGDARIDMDTTLESGSVLLKGSVHMPMVFDMHWRSLTFGYAFRPAPWLTVAFQVHKHLFTAGTAGDLRPDVSGRITVSGEGANTSFLVEYPDTRVYGSARGEYQGKAWSPELGVSAGPVTLVSRMGARMRAHGYLDVEYNVPYFVDPETFEMRFSEPDSFLTADNLGRLLNAEVGRKVMRVRESLFLSIPQSHTLAVDLWRGKVTLSYTKVFGHLSIHGAGTDPAPAADASDASSGGPAASAGDPDASSGGDSVITSTEGFIDLDLWPDQVMLVTGDFGWFHGSLGAHTLNVGYRGRKNLLSGLSALEWDGDPLVPILGFGFAWGRPVQITMDFHISPLPAVRTGMVYVF